MFFRTSFTHLRKKVQATRFQGLKRESFVAPLRSPSMARLILPTFLLASFLVVAPNSFINVNSSLAQQDQYVAVEPIESAPAQSVIVPSTVKSEFITRDSYSSTEKPRISWAGIIDAGTFINNPDAAVQYPFGIGVPISDGFGHREVVCTDEFGCGTNHHNGTDFAADANTPIQAIANGVVIDVNSSGSFGTHVLIQHNIEGAEVVSTYAHMVSDSVKVVKGQNVTVGDEIGRVGSTGRSTGPHLHFELMINGKSIDPMLWDKWNTGVRTYNAG